MSSQPSEDGLSIAKYRVYLKEGVSVPEECEVRKDGEKGLYYEVSRGKGCSELLDKVLEEQEEQEGEKELRSDGSAMELAVDKAIAAQNQSRDTGRFHFGKTRRYVDSREEAPEGVQVYEGERGGLYWETGTGSDSGGSEPGEEATIDPEPRVDESSGYQVDTEFGESVAEFTAEGDVVGNVVTAEWLSNSADVEDPDLLLDALAQYASEGGYGTIRDRLRTRLGALDVDGEDIHERLYTEPGPEEPEIDVSEVVGNIGIPSSDGLTGFQPGYQELWEEATTEQLEEYVESQREGDFTTGSGAVVENLLYYRDDSDVSFDDVVDYVVAAPIGGERQDEVLYQTLDRGIMPALDEMHPAHGAQVLGSINQIRFTDLDGPSGDASSATGDIRLDPAKADSQTAAHELGHMFHNMMGVVAEDYGDIDNRDVYLLSRWKHGLSENRNIVPLGDEFREDAVEGWDQYKKNDRSQIRPYQRRHGVEHLAITYQNWVHDEQGLINKHPEMYAFWEQYAGGNKRIEDYEDLQEGDTALLWDNSGTSAEITDVSDTGFTYSIAGEEHEYDAEWDEIAEKFVGGIRET